MSQKNFWTKIGSIIHPNFEAVSSLNLIPGAIPFTMTGQNATLSVAEETIWEGTGVFVYPTIASPLELVSTSAQDGIAGDGARSMRIVGLDDQFIMQEEILALNGTTPVQTVGNYFRLMIAQVNETGDKTGPANLGDISITHTGEALEMGLILATDGKLANAILTVPANTCALLYALTITLGRTTQGNDVNSKITGRTRRHTGNAGYFRIIPLWLHSGDYEEHYDVPLYLPEKTDLDVIAFTDTGNRDAPITLNADFILYDLDYLGELEPGQISTFMREIIQG